MDVEVRHDDVRPVVRVSGDLDDAVALIGAVHVALTDEPEVVLVDARECGFIDEHGVAALMAVNKLSRRVGVPLQLVPSPAIARRLEALWLTSHFSFAKA